MIDPLPAEQLRMIGMVLDRTARHCCLANCNWNCWSIGHGRAGDLIVFAVQSKPQAAAAGCKVWTDDGGE